MNARAISTDAGGGLDTLKGVALGRSRGASPNLCRRAEFVGVPYKWRCARTAPKFGVGGIGI